MEILKKTLAKKIIMIFISITLLATSSMGFVECQQIVNKKDTQENYLTKETAENLYELLIITPQEFSKYVQPLVDHKNKYGIKTISVTLVDVYDDNDAFWNGRDDAEKVKYFIKKSIENWGIKYVLLVGGVKGQSNEQWWIPVRYSYLNRPYNKQAEGKFLTDLYFADIYDSEDNFSSWDADNDGLFGEWPLDCAAEDIPDLKPDVYVGRLPCRNIFEVRAIVKKIINYETQSFSDSWFKKLLVIAGDTYPNKTDYIDGEVHTQQAIDLMSDFEPVKLWASEGTLKNWFGIVRQINKGCGFVFFSGHGAPDVWITHPVNNSKKWIGEFKLRHMPFLFNKNKLPVILSGSGCFSNMFNVSLVHSEHIDFYLTEKLVIPYGIPRCWGWSLTRKPNGGGIAVISSTGYSYESSDIDSKSGGCEWLDIHFFEQYSKENISFLGKCWGNTITRGLENFTINWNDASKTGDALIVKNIEQWLLIGDPSLKIGGYN